LHSGIQKLYTLAAVAKTIFRHDVIPHCSMPHRACHHENSRTVPIILQVKIGHNVRPNRLNFYT